MSDALSLFLCVKSLEHKLSSAATLGVILTLISVVSSRYLFMWIEDIDYRKQKILGGTRRGTKILTRPQAAAASD